MTAFEYIYEKNFPIVYKYVLSLCRNSLMAEEITQEAFVKAMEHMEQFDGKCQLYVWICQIAKNTYYTALRKQKRFSTEAQGSIEIEENPEAALLDKETVEQIYRLIGQLREPYNEVFSLRVFGELSFSQIGELFEKSDSWARLVYYRAKKQLREDLNE